MAHCSGNIINELHNNDCMHESPSPGHSGTIINDSGLHDDVGLHACTTGSHFDSAVSTSFTRCVDSASCVVQQVHSAILGVEGPRVCGVGRAVSKSATESAITPPARESDVCTSDVKVWGVRWSSIPKI